MLRRRVVAQREQRGVVGVEDAVGVGVDLAQVGRQRRQPVRAAQALQRPAVRRQHQRPHEVEAALRERQRHPARPRQHRQRQRAVGRPGAPVGIRDGEVRHAGQPRADRQRQAEVADDELGLHAVEQREVVGDVVAQLGQGVDRLSGGQALREARRRDAAQRLGLRRAGAEEAPRGVGAGDARVVARRVEAGGQRRRPRQMRQRHGLGDEQDAGAGGHGEGGVRSATMRTHPG